MTYQAERFHVAASIEGLGIVWEETIHSADLGAMVQALRSPSAGDNVLAENGYDLSKLSIAIRAVPLSDFDREIQDHRAAQAREADLDAAEAAERAERVARSIAAAEAELKAAGVEFELTSADTYAFPSRDGRTLGTVERASRHNGGRWTFHTPDGALAFTTPGRLTMLRRLVKTFA